MILVVGANGMLGQDLMGLLGERGRGVDLPDIDITDMVSVQQVLTSLRPKVVINCAAYTDVDGCETNTETAMQVNGEGVAFLGLVTRAIGAKLVQVSTDYVFDGVKKVPYTETDLPNPLNFYALTKLAGEHAARIYCENHKILRVGGIYGKIPCRAKGGVNFVSAMLRQAETRKEINVVSDEFITPTYTVDIARQTELLLGRSETGIFHVSNEGYCSWFEFAEKIFSFCRLPVKVNPIPSSAYTSLLKRPSWSVLDNSRLKALGIYRMQTWQEALKEHLQNLGYE